MEPRERAQENGRRPDENKYAAQVTAGEWNRGCQRR